MEMEKYWGLTPPRAGPGFNYSGGLQHSKLASHGVGHCLAGNAYLGWPLPVAHAHSQGLLGQGWLMGWRLPSLGWVGGGEERSGKGRGKRGEAGEGEG